MLNLCEIPPICEYLSIPSNPATIFSNSPNCVIRANVEAACLALPITLLSFQAQPQKTNTHLTWRTASETNNDRFEVEHSRNGVSFEAIGTLAGQGTTTEPHDYAFTHERPGHGTHYYRLRQVDFDGRFSYSDIVSVDIDNHEGLKNVILWPNPTTGIVQLDIKLDEGVSYAVSDALGRMLIQGQLVTPYIDLSALPDGTYTMHLTNAIHVTARRILKASN
ncbi:MAG TPA: T9SS type A sorting domain-containing protein [Saprospiraceae bacterium]|nr:T9SS type A sorting domain-containing protein [Saprospiraceae bacterium]HMQ81625.1 T9SS type A sorting domain-containing protein [Saprospiraceae bacterium]